jgi:hypothetical protein
MLILIQKRAVFINIYVSSFVVLGGKVRPVVPYWWRLVLFTSIDSLESLFTTRCSKHLLITIGSFVFFNLNILLVLLSQLEKEVNS